MSQRVNHIIDTSSTPSSVSGRKWPFFFEPTAFQLLARVRNVQKSYYWPCKISKSESRRQFQRFYYEKTLVGWIDSDAWEGRNLSCPIPTYLHSHETPTNKCNLSVFVASGVWGRTAAARDSALVLFKAILWEMLFATNKIK